MEEPRLIIGSASDPDGEHRQWSVDEGDHGQRLDKSLVRHAPEFSRTHLQSLIGRGLVHVDGRPATSASARLRLGQVVGVELLPTEQAQAFRPQPMELDIVHEDEHVLVINKPVGLVVHPAPGHWSGTLLNGLLARDARAADLPRAGIVHRLDKDTSGLMVVGRTAQACRGLSEAIAQRQVHRTYWAMAHGPIAADLQTVEAPIGRDPQSRVRMAVLRAGKPAQTTVRVLARLGREVSAIECTLHTGRTHQIRVHLAHLGHPLVGDATYGGAAWHGVQRQALHARRLALQHPVSGQSLQWQAPLAEDLAQAWAATGAQATIGGN